MNIIPFLSRLIGRTEDKPQTHSHLLELPTELIIEILKFLPHYSHFLVYQTCSPLRAITYQFLRKRELLPTRAERMTYLIHLGRSLPDQWVCGKCLKFHRIKEKDIPTSNKRHDPKCLKDDPDTQFGAHTRFGPYDFCPSHRHVQLTLKYTRLDDNAQKRRHRRYLQRLTAPRHSRMQSLHDIDRHISINPWGFFESFGIDIFTASRLSKNLKGYGTIQGISVRLVDYLRFFGIHEDIIARVPDYTKIVDIDEGISAQRAVYPKVVDGRYLLLSAWDYLEARTKVSRRSIWRICICPHMRSCGQTIGPQNEKAIIDTALDEAFSAANTTIGGSCHSCRTDYAIKASPERVTIWAWQDFGSEGTMWDPDWLAIVCSLDANNPGVKHRPGSIRELYGTVNMSKGAIN